MKETFFSFSTRMSFLFHIAVVVVVVVFSLSSEVVWLSCHRDFADVKILEQLGPKIQEQYRFLFEFVIKLKKYSKKKNQHFSNFFLKLHMINAII